jgi:hypothetical protein
MKRETKREREKNKDTGVEVGWCFSTKHSLRKYFKNEDEIRTRE